jgi:hypothetical protein
MQDQRDLDECWNGRYVIGEDWMICLDHCRRPRRESDSLNIAPDDDGLDGPQRTACDWRRCSWRT